MSTAEILERTSGGYDVYEYYYTRSPHYKGNAFTIYRKMPSPFRDDDGDPSFSIHPHRSRGKDELWYKDFGDTHRDAVGNCFTFVAYLFGLDIKKDFPAIIAKIKADVLGISQGVYYKPLCFVDRSTHKVERPRLALHLETASYRRAWTNRDLLYFARSMVTKPMTVGQAKEFAERQLDRYHIFPVSRYASVLGGNTRLIPATTQDPIYVIYFPRTGRSKIYRPFTPDKKNKWRSNTRAEEDIFGYDLLPDKCERLFVTAGNRDTLGWDAWIGEPCFPPNSETCNIAPSLFQQMSARSDSIYSVMNNDYRHRNKKTGLVDNTGLKAETRMLREYGILPANSFLKISGINDVADFIRLNMEAKNYYALEVVKEYILSLKFEMANVKP